MKLSTPAETKNENLNSPLNTLILCSQNFFAVWII